MACPLAQATSHEDVPDRRHRDREQECAIWHRHGPIAARAWRDLNLTKPRRIKASISRGIPGFRTSRKSGAELILRNRRRWPGFLPSLPIAVSLFMALGQSNGYLGQSNGYTEMRKLHRTDPSLMQRLASNKGV